MDWSRGIRVRLVPPLKMVSDSFGEVTSPATLTPWRGRPAADGLFSERIFGPVGEGQCACGKFLSAWVRLPGGIFCGYHGLETELQSAERWDLGEHAPGLLCDVCWVEVGRAGLRRERMAHLNLAAPICPPWFRHRGDSPIARLLDWTSRELDEVLDHAVHVEQGTGVAAVRDRLRKIDLDELAARLRQEVLRDVGPRRQRRVQRLQVVEAFRRSDQRPEWLILDQLPILPPDLRPLAGAEPGRVVLGELNARYARVIDRNNRLEELLHQQAPQGIIRHATLRLQQAADALLRSLAERAGGRLCGELLAKRVDYSGRSVVVPAPELRLDQCGLPKEMALELFKPFVIRRLQDNGTALLRQEAVEMIGRGDPAVWKALAFVIDEHPVLLAVADTLDRRGVLACDPVLVDGSAIRVHPTALAMLGTGAAGDELNVHVPLAASARREARERMQPSDNLLLPASGGLAVQLSADAALGCQYLALVRPALKGDGEVFADGADALLAWELGAVELQAAIKVRLPAADGRRWIVHTSVGRIIFNAALDDGLALAGSHPLPFHNDVIDTGVVASLIGNLARDRGSRVAAAALEAVERLGRAYATRSGTSIAIDNARPAAGSNAHEYFLASRAARRRLRDGASSRRGAARLLRRLVGAAGDVTVTEEDCGTQRGIWVDDLLRVGGRRAQLLGRVPVEQVIGAATGEIVVVSGNAIDERAREHIAAEHIPSIHLRSPLTCQTRHGICRRCYGWDPARHTLVELGAAVGVLAAQAIAAPAADQLSPSSLEKCFEARARMTLDLLRLRGVDRVARYLIDEVQAHYVSTGARLDDKHVEVIVRQMLRYVRVDQAGDTGLLPGELVDMFSFRDVNASVIELGGEPATGSRVLLGVSRTARRSTSFLAAAAYGDPIRVLAKAAISGRIDGLVGLTASVLVGNPAGAFPPRR